MVGQHRELDFSGQVVFVAIDVHKRSWHVAIMVNDMFHKTFRQDPHTALLVKYLHRNFPGARYHCVYEAGYCGFWIHDQLRASGIDCMVINPADVPHVMLSGQAGMPVLPVVDSWRQTGMFVLPVSIHKA